MRTLDLNLLLVFDALIAEQNVTRAAAKLAMSQPAVSNALMRLRRFVDDPLFVRTRAGMKPTARALSLYAEVHDGLGLIQRALERSPIFDAARSTRQFRILVSDLGEVIYLPALMRRLAVVAPSVSVATVQIPRDRFRDGLESGEADIALGSQPQLGANFYRQRLFFDKYVCLVSEQHPRVHKVLTVKRFTEERHIVVVPAGNREAATEEAFRSARIVRRVAATVGHYLPVPLMVRDTEWLGAVPSRLYAATPVPGVRPMKLPFEVPPFGLYQYWHARCHEDVACKWLRAQVFEVLGEHATMRA